MAGETLDVSALRLSGHDPVAPTRCFESRGDPWGGQWAIRPVGPTPSNPVRERRLPCTRPGRVLNMGLALSTRE